MTTRPAAFRTAARAAQQLLADPAVEQAWDRPSALAEFRVSGLAGHLGIQLLRLPGLLAAPQPDEAPRALVDHYAAAAWVDVPLDDPSNVEIRKGGDREAAGGAPDLADRVGAVVVELDALLAAEPADRVLYLPWARWSLRLDDYLLTRMLEIAVHCDDLAVSVGIETPTLPAEVFDPVLHLLADVAVQRHGQPALLRALSRSERAPAHINAI